MPDSPTVPLIKTRPEKGYKLVYDEIRPGDIVIPARCIVLAQLMLLRDEIPTYYPTEVAKEAAAGLDMSIKIIQTIFKES